MIIGALRLPRPGAEAPGVYSAHAGGAALRQKTPPQSLSCGEEPDSRDVEQTCESERANPEVVLLAYHRGRARRRPWRRDKRVASRFGRQQIVLRTSGLVFIRVFSGPFQQFFHHVRIVRILGLTFTPRANFQQIAAWEFNRAHRNMMLGAKHERTNAISTPACRVKIHLSEVFSNLFAKQIQGRRP
jgi:hypothetical protein